MTYDPGPTLHKNPCAPGLTTNTQPSPGHAGHNGLTGRTMHNDLSALLELLDTIVGLAHVRAQVTLADVVDGEDAGELCVSLLDTRKLVPGSSWTLSHVPFPLANSNLCPFAVYGECNSF